MLEIDSAELVDWIAFFNLEPWGSAIDDLRTGSTLSMMANINRDPKKTPNAFGPLDFVTWSSDRRDPESSEPILIDDPEAQTALLRATLFRNKSR